MRRLRNSTWRGAHNAPHCGTDSVPGGRKLGAESESWAPVLTLMDRVSAPVPANGAALNVSQVHSPRRLPLIESSCSARHQGRATCLQSCSITFLTESPPVYIDPFIPLLITCLYSVLMVEDR